MLNVYSNGFLSSPDGVYWLCHVSATSRVQHMDSQLAKEKKIGFHQTQLLLTWQNGDASSDSTQPLNKPTRWIRYLYRVCSPQTIDEAQWMLYAHTLLRMTRRNFSFFVENLFFGRHRQRKKSARFSPSKLYIYFVFEWRKFPLLKTGNLLAMLSRRL